MKTVPLWLAIVVAPVLAAGAFQQRPTAPSGPVAFVVSQRISNETTEGKAGIARIQVLQRERAAAARTKQDALQATRRQIDATQDSAERSRLQAQEQQQRTDLERAVAQSQVDLQNLQRQISNELGTKVKAAIEELVKGTGVQLVLSADTTVVWSTQGLDLTSPVIERLNARAAAPTPNKP
jgi:Skp family chaperone for outer membrane proteins